MRTFRHRVQTIAQGLRMLLPVADAVEAVTGGVARSRGVGLIPGLRSCKAHTLLIGLRHGRARCGPAVEQIKPPSEPWLFHSLCNLRDILLTSPQLPSQR